MKRQIAQLLRQGMSVEFQSTIDENGYKTYQWVVADIEEGDVINGAMGFNNPAECFQDFIDKN